MKLTVYTAIFGDYDILEDPLYISNKIKYVCFTDKERDSKVWDVRIVERTEETPRRDARKYKILSHKYIDTPISIWVDGNRDLIGDPVSRIKSLLKKFDFISRKHPRRKCIYSEADRCLEMGKGDPNRIREQVERYKAEDYPENNGLIGSSVLIRRITPKIIQVEKDWWDEIVNGCCRDQVSFNYVAWKNKLDYGIINWGLFVKGRRHIGKRRK